MKKKKVGECKMAVTVARVHTQTSNSLKEKNKYKQNRTKFQNVF